MTASRSAPSRRCLFHVEHITCGRRPGCCGERNCADAFCADSLSLTRPSSAALGSTWNSETGLWGYGRCPEETPLDDHQLPFWTTGCLRPLYPPNRRQLAIRASFVRPGVDVLC